MQIYKKTKMTIYRNNYIKQVILRIDFESVNLWKFTDFDTSAKSIDELFDWSYDVITENFIEISNDSSNSKQSKRPKWTCNQWDFKIEISHNFMVATFDKYSDKWNLEKVLNLIVLFLDTFWIKQIERAWLRYINHIDDLDIKTSSDWKNYINENLIAWLTFSESLWWDLVRDMSNMYIKKWNNIITFIYWFWNNSYPSKMLDWYFILDFDCYTNIPLLLDKSSDIENIFNQFNTDITDIFEKSINESLRSKLNS